MNAKHTPGPWVATKNGYINTADHTAFIGTVSSANGEEAELANARLIATVPELLLLAQEIDSYWSSGNFSRPQDLWERLRSAIAKATGE